MYKNFQIYFLCFAVLFLFVSTQCMFIKTYRVFVFYFNLFLLSIGIFVAWIGVQGQTPQFVTLRSSNIRVPLTTVRFASFGQEICGRCGGRLYEAGVPTTRLRCTVLYLYLQIANSD